MNILGTYVSNNFTIVNPVSNQNYPRDSSRDDSKMIINKIQGNLIWGVFLDQIVNIDNSKTEGRANFTGIRLPNHQIKIVCDSQTSSSGYPCIIWLYPDDQGFFSSVVIPELGISGGGRYRKISNLS